MGKAKTNTEWLNEHLKKISDLGQKINDAHPTTDYASHTALKIIAVRFVSDIFTKVASDPRRKIEGFDGAVYIDLFAGTGLVKVTDTGYVVAGSAPCAVTTEKGFRYSILVEKDKDRCKYLEERMLKIIRRDDFEVINGDSNEIIQEVIEKIKSKFKNPIILVFVDPEGMEIKFETVKALSDNFQSCDFLINVNEQGVLRVAGKARKGITNIIASLEGYFNKPEQDIQHGLAQGKTAQEQYANQVNELGRTIGVNIKIRESSNSIAYHLLSYTRLTSGGSNYSRRPLESLKQRIEVFTERDVKSVLEQIHGGTKLMDDFLC